MSGSVEQPVGGSGAGVAFRALLQRRFYFFMSLAIAVIVTYGFHFTVGTNLLHPAIPRPFLLYIHAATFTAWLAIFIAQTALVTTGNTHLHKRLGLVGIVVGVAVVVVGLSTTVVMTQFHAAHPAPGDDPRFVIVPFNDIAAFAGLFRAAIALRRTNCEAHRRLMLMARCALTAAGWGRFPAYLVPDGWFYLGVDALVLLGVGRDLVVMRRVHPAYLYGLPAMVAGQVAALAVIAARPAWWMAAVHAIGRAGG